MVLPKRVVEMVDHLACLARSMVWHERLIGGINVESPACGAQSKTTVVCKLQWKYDKKFWLFVILWRKRRKMFGGMKECSYVCGWMMGFASGEEAGPVQVRTDLIRNIPRQENETLAAIVRKQLWCSGKMTFNPIPNSLFFYQIIFSYLLSRSLWPLSAIQQWACSAVRVLPWDFSCLFRQRRLWPTTACSTLPETNWSLGINTLSRYRKKCLPSDSWTIRKPRWTYTMNSIIPAMPSNRQ